MNENHELETLRDQYRQLNVERELAKMNEDMFRRLYKKWRKENQRLQIRLSLLSDKIDQIQKTTP